MNSRAADTCRFVLLCKHQLPKPELKAVPQCLKLGVLFPLWGKHQAANLSQCTYCRKGTLQLSAPPGCHPFCPDKNCLLPSKWEYTMVTHTSNCRLTQEHFVEPCSRLTFRHTSLSPKPVCDCINISTFVREINKYASSSAGWEKTESLTTWVI